MKYSASTVVTRKSPTSGRAASREDAAPMSRLPTSPAREGPSSISCSARASRAERRKGGEAAYHAPTRSSRPFHRAGKPSITSGSRADHCRSSIPSRTSSSATAPPSTTSSSVVTRAAAKERRTPIRRRRRWTGGSTMALSASASRKGSRGTSSHRKKTTAPPSQSRAVIVLCKKTLNCDI